MRISDWSSDVFSSDLLAQEGDGSALGIVRSPEDQLFIYTGGTTGMPKGVMWHHDQMRKAQLEAQKLLAPVPQTLEEHVALITSQGPGNRTLPSCPMMHGTGFITPIRPEERRAGKEGVRTL